MLDGASEVSGAAGAEEAPKRLPRARRITRSGEIRALHQRGKRSRTAHLDVFDSASPVPFSRVGVVVPKHRHTGVERNRLKRRLREVLRTAILPGLETRGARLNVLVRARGEAYEATYPELLEELTQWLHRRCSRGR